ncbi:hypothetical protein [Bartonella sp. CM120XJJH]|uniref:hypothetical protein n=1 Tax=Bartonella sp. CM120XJJH TaxID=3243544 RepID=UPI0035CEEE44
MLRLLLRVTYSLLSGLGAMRLEENVPRFSEIGIMLPKGEDVDKLYAEWKEQTTVEINVLKKPYTDVFGRTFLIKDPDGHIIRVCPLD